MGSGEAQAADVVGCLSMGSDVNDLPVGSRELNVSGEVVVMDSHGLEVTDATSYISSTSKVLYLGRGCDGDGGD